MPQHLPRVTSAFLTAHAPCGHGRAANGTIPGDEAHVGTSHALDWALQGTCRADEDGTCEFPAPTCQGARAALLDVIHAVSSRPAWARAAVREAIARYDAHQQAWRAAGRRVLQRVAGFTSRAQPAAEI